ncbi:MAG: ABC transporter ATP-binding protein/permease [Flavobacteriales bacterium]|nr:ABC transporter ATP-binding protein/permease [Flavobacteriales bacterium]
METNNQPKLTPFRKFMNIINLDRKDIIQIYFYAILAGLLNLTLPLGIQVIINLIGGAQISTSWLIMVILISVAVSFSGFFQIIQLYMTEKVQQRIFARTSFEYAFRLPKLQLEKLGSKHLPELMNRFFDAISLQKGLSKLLLDFSAAVLQTLFGIILLSLYHPFFIILGVTIVTVILIIIRFTGEQGMKTSLEESDYKYKMAFWLEEAARTSFTFKLAGVTDFITKKTDEIIYGYVGARKRHFRVLMRQYSALVIFKIVMICGLLILGSLLVINQQMNVGQFVASEIVIILIIGSVEKLMLSMETIYDVLTSVEKISKISNLELEDEDGECFDTFVDQEDQQGIAIGVNGLSFKYNGGPMVIKNISFDIKPNEKVCVSGFNNSGKTTLLQLISGLYTNLDNGTITYNNIPLGNLKLDSLRSYIGDSLAQETLFEGSLMDNISMGRKRATVENVVWAIDQVGLTEFIKKLPKGYNTMVEPLGKTLPQSIARKIVLARSIADKPRLLVLADTFSHLEKERMEKVKKLLFKQKNPWTMVIASNDIEVANGCDRVLVLKDGEVVAFDKFRKHLEEDWFHKVFI